MNPEVPAEGTGCFRVPHSPRGWARNQMPRVQIPALPLSSHGILWGLSFPIYKMKIKVFTYDMLWVELCPPTFASVSPTPVPQNVTGSLQRNSG